MSTIIASFDETPIPDQAAARLVATALERLTLTWDNPPDLETLAAEAGLSAWHFQRVFTQWAGISPKRFSQYVALGQAKRLLDNNLSILDTALDTGLSGPGRLHDLFVSCEGMTPGEYKAAGASLVIHWGLHDTPLGRIVLGITERGICWLSFVADGDEDAAQREFMAEWGRGTLVRDEAVTAPYAEKVAAGMLPLSAEKQKPEFRLLLRGTNFQIKVWEALLRIPPGDVVRYGDVAKTIGHPTAHRAVGSAVGANLISWLIPCHRVIQSSGIIHNYRWGPLRKRVLLAWEGARYDSPSTSRME